uniref:Uncharacterized protein n=1 Tax=Arundo donax TaxID=35708 RepID=A0A0A8Y9X8_ARUDO
MEDTEIIYTEPSPGSSISTVISTYLQYQNHHPSHVQILRTKGDEV